MPQLSEFFILSISVLSTLRWRKGQEGAVHCVRAGNITDIIDLHLILKKCVAKPTFDFTENFTPMKKFYGAWCNFPFYVNELQWHSREMWKFHVEIFTLSKNKSMRTLEKNSQAGLIHLLVARQVRIQFTIGLHFSIEITTISGLFEKQRLRHQFPYMEIGVFQYGPEIVVPYCKIQFD